MVLWHQQFASLVLTLLIIVVACVFYIRYNAYFRNPWTRDGMGAGGVVQVARVSVRTDRISR